MVSTRFSNGSTLPSATGPVAGSGQSPEAALTRLLRLTSGLLHAPVALVVLVEGGWPRLASGVGLPDGCGREIPASHPFWARILGSGEPASLEDAPVDGGPLVNGLAMAAWLGVPLSTLGGDALGCLCVAAPQPRAWSEQEVALLRDLAALGSAGMVPDEHPRGRPSAEAAILESIPHACFALDGQWRFTHLNPRAQQLFGQLSRHPGAQLLGRNIWDECPEVADSTFARECQQALAEQRPLEAETFYPGLGRWFAVHISPLLGEGVSVFLQDVNERTRLARALGQTTEHLVEADRGKEEFLVQLTHEVRNALAPVRNALHLIQGRGLDDPEDEQACALAEQEVQRLTRLMDNLLKVAQLIPGNVRLEKKQINLSALVARALTGMLSSAAGGRSLTVYLPPEPVWLDAGEEQLEQVLEHLLDNAAKFTRPGGHIHFTVEREAGTAVLRVRDDGVGMSADVLPRVFNLFMRGDRRTAQFRGGIGIGLTLVRHLVELHGGTVEARSEGPGRGSEFIVRLPAPEGAPAGPSWQERGGGDGDRPLRVLVVDDCMDNAQSLGLILGRWGYEVQVVYDGPHTLKVAADWRPDVVLMDIEMPGMSGYEVAERLRQVEGAEKVVLVAVSGYSNDEVRRRAREAGFDHQLVKPLDPAELKELLTTAERSMRQ